MKEVPIGTRGETEETVEFQHTLSAHHASLPPVYSTPDMIRLMETAAFHACNLTPKAMRLRSGPRFMWSIGWRAASETH